MADRLKGQTHMSRYKQGTEYDPDKRGALPVCKHSRHEPYCGNKPLTTLRHCLDCGLVFVPAKRMAP